MTDANTLKQAIKDLYNEAFKYDEWFFTGDEGKEQYNYERSLYTALLLFLGDMTDRQVNEFAQMDEDAKAFEPLSKAYGIPKDDPTRDQVLEECLHNAAEPPMNILRLSCEAMDLIAEYAEKGSRLVISDAGCAAAMAEAAIRSAALNVAINTRLMKDRDYAEKMNEELDALVAKYVPMAEEAFELVYGGLR